MPASVPSIPRHHVQRLNIVGDCLALVVASLVATEASLGRGWLLALGIAVGAIAVWLTGSRALRHYDTFNGRGVASDVALTAVQLVSLLAVLAATRRFAPEAAFATSLTRFAVIAVPSIAWLRGVTSWVRRREPPVENVLVVGIGPLGRHTGLDLHERAKKAPRAVCGYLRFEDEALHARLNAPVLGVAGDLEEVLKKQVVDEVYIAGNGDSQRAAMQSAIRVCERFGIPFALPAAGFRFGRAQPVHAEAVADGYVHYLSVRNKPVQLAIKRAIDIVASSVALALLSPLLLGVALAIKLTSRGPILFKQVRVGQHGRTFHMLKFRSMVVNAEELKAKLLAQNEQTGPVFKMARDPRITAIGRFIRKYSVDELPQLLNILRGEMTIVGPRPPVPTEVAQYEAWQRRRLSVRPGLTCVWQVSGRNQISFEEWMYLDMQYIDHWSLAQDIALIARTVPVVLTGRGAS